MSRTRKTLIYLGLLSDGERRRIGPVELMAYTAVMMCGVFALDHSFAAAALAFVAALALLVAASTHIPQPPRLRHRHDR